MGHAGPVHLRQDPLLKVELGIEIKELSELRAEGPALKVVVKDPEGIRSLERPPDAIGEQLLLLLRGEGPEPEVVALYGGIRDTLDELLGPEVEAHVVEGYGKPPHHSLKDRPCRRGYPFVQAGEDEGLIGGIAGKELITPIPS